MGPPYRQLYEQTDHSLAGLARAFNMVVRGWMQYYGALFGSMLHPPTLAPLNRPKAANSSRHEKRALQGRELGSSHQPVIQPTSRGRANVG